MNPCHYHETRQRDSKMLLFLFRLSPLLACCTSPGRWVSSRCTELQGKSKYSEKTCPPRATLSTTNPTLPHPNSNPVRRGGRTATNRLGYSTAIEITESHLRTRTERWIVCAPFITLATHQHMEYHCKALSETPCKSHRTVTIPGRTRRVLLHDDSSKHRKCPLSKVM
jgi:hypothetical protein